MPLPQLVWHYCSTQAQASNCRMSNICAVIAAPFPVGLHRAPPQCAAHGDAAGRARASQQRTCQGAQDVQVSAGREGGQERQGGSDCGVTLRRVHCACPQMPPQTMAKVT